MEPAIAARKLSLQLAMHRLDRRKVVRGKFLAYVESSAR